MWCLRLATLSRLGRHRLETLVALYRLPAFLTELTKLQMELVQQLDVVKLREIAGCTSSVEDNECVDNSEIDEPEIQGLVGLLVLDAQLQRIPTSCSIHD